MACTIDLLTFNECGARGQEQEAFGTKLSEDVTGLPRLYAKQAPARGWEAVQAPQWVQKQLERSGPDGAMVPRPMKRQRARFCQGFSELMACLFSTSKVGQPVRDPWGGQKCLFCDPERMAAACETVKGRSHVTRSLKAFRSQYEQQNYVYYAAILRVPDEWREKFHTKALKQKRGTPKRQAPVAQHAASAARRWKDVLVSRKRAFSSLGSKEVTAYKKRRAADRNRVAKKFFLDNDLPQPEADDIAENECGLPMPATSERAAFVEQWCKFGSWAICKECRSLQPRPLEPVDTRRVAPAEMTAKKCKQCSGKQWVPQPQDIPKVLQKLSLKLSKVLRPLDIDVGPVKKANNGYRSARPGRTRFVFL